MKRKIIIKRYVVEFKIPRRGAKRNIGVNNQCEASRRTEKKRWFEGREARTARAIPKKRIWSFKSSENKEI
jgi:hypothetical protein